MAVSTISCSQGTKVNLANLVYNYERENGDDLIGKRIWYGWGPTDFR